MEQVKKDLEVLERFTSKEYGNIPHYGEYSSIFIFGTENQEAINNIIDYKGKEVLTVASSADQYISAMYYGAIKAEIFDINRFTYYISYLKIAAIKGLDYEEFLKFMMPLRNGEKTKEFWNLKVLKKILGIMPKDVAYFWERAFYVFTKYGLGNFTFLTDKSTNELSITMGMPFYAREEEYYKLKNILKETDYPKFYLSRLSNLSSVVKDCYDIVYLSNIIECMVYETLSSYPYFYPVNENNVELEKINIVGEQVLQMLKKDGIILMSYRANTSLENSPDILYNNDFFEATLVPAKIDASNRNDNRNADTDIVLTYCPSTKGNFLG